MKFSGLKVFVATIGVVFLATACQEKCLEIPRSLVGNRKVLLEEITGVDCPNCPQGTEEINALQQQHGRNLIAVAIHGGSRGFFNKKINGTRIDFNTDEMEQLVQQIGTPTGYPAAAINRDIIAGNTDIFNDRPWGGAVAQAFQPDFNLGLFIHPLFNPVSRLLEIEITIAPDQTLIGDHALTVYLVQDSIADAQNKNGTIIPNYMHRHVLRKVLTPVAGDPIGQGLIQGATITRRFSYTLPQDFVEKHCSVVALVHRMGAQPRLVVQAEGKYIKP